MTRGSSMHDTNGHKGRNKVAYRSPDGGSAPAPAPAGPSLSASLAQGPAPAPSQVTFADEQASTFAPGPMFRASPRTDYDFSHMPRSETTPGQSAGGHLASLDASSSWWDIISGDYSSYLKE